MVYGYVSPLSPIASSFNLATQVSPSTTLPIGVSRLLSTLRLFLETIYSVSKQETNLISIPSMYSLCFFFSYSRSNNHVLSNGHRTDPNYDATSFFNEWGLLIQALDADPKILNKHMLIGPSVEGAWSPESVWATGFIDTYKDRMYALAVEQ